MPPKPPAPVYLPGFQKLVPALLGEDWAHDDGLTGAEVDRRLDESPAAEQLGEDLVLPAALREFYLALGNCGDLLETAHFFWDPDDLEVRDGFLMFLEDAEETVVWGLPVDNLPLPDPIVWRRSSGADDEDGEWTDEGGTFSEFVTDLLAWTFEDEEEDR
ncbi:hypothetical protein ACSBQY_01605 [Micrococcus lylae]|uniref:hypothetical protein n=1 Tax=Micrococcus TaxID=1269 RepID=UPI0008A11721|nr:MULTISPECIES: hypothetical protein [Micrococcus]MCT2007680.1 hypothetical protein [Micrococcus lylae]MCT2071826.1 hypothetical protein [Micrococcus lylae]OFR91407.1 hypothetical protein HMPREF2863_04725 [Micrococcus sp. HMSC067E09]PNL18536.1 hypothetical protein CEQ11_011005 [Micrococcus sp. FDAARGOS_333]WIK81267.1 hypothetical protein CJ228_006490 [Micrococcus lylae]